MKRFLKFIDSNGQHDAESITNHILRTLTTLIWIIVVVKVTIMRAIYQENTMECKPDSNH